MAANTDNPSALEAGVPPTPPAHVPTTIRIADAPPRRSESTYSAGVGAADASLASPSGGDRCSRTTTHHLDPGLAGGIYNTRSLDRSRSFSRTPGTRMRRRRTPSFAPADHSGEDDASIVSDAWLQDSGRKKQVFRGRTLLWLAYQSIGVIYGDIGTSPLYVYSSTFTSAPTPHDLVQVLSVIIWALTIVVTIKYVVIVLMADNEGEGGTFSCYSLLTRYANITDRAPSEQTGVHIKRHLTSELGSGAKRVRGTLEESKFFRGLLKAVGVLAVSMVMSDGVLTPAQSILGAVQGLSVVSPDISQSTVVGTTCGIIVLLFLIQPLGTSILASGFAPVVILWLGFNGGFGIYNLVKYDSSVLRAFSPHFVFQFFIEHGTAGWKMLGGILLAFTGVEALFADLGAFSLGAIRMSWLFYTYPCLLLAYIGQAAFLSVNPDAYSNPFFNSVPPGMLYPSLVLAVLAAIVASQAIITATFQLVSQIMKLSYCPQVKVVHTSRIFHGQLYVPFLNWLLMAGAILVTAVFRNTTSLGNAYGVCVMFVTFFDTCMVTLVALIVWRLHWALVVLPFLFFATTDGLFLSSSLIKVPDGAWITLLVSGLLASLFLLWRFGKESQWRAEAEDRFKPGTLVTIEALSSPSSSQPRPSTPLSPTNLDPATAADKGSSEKAAHPTTTATTTLRLTDKWGGEHLSSIRGLGIFFDKIGIMTPMVYTQFVTKFAAMPQIAVFFHLHPVETPTVPDEERYVVARIREIPGCYRLVVRHGFMDEVISPDLAALIYNQVREFVASGQGPPHHSAYSRRESRMAAATSSALGGPVASPPVIIAAPSTSTSDSVAPTPGGATSASTSSPSAGGGNGGGLDEEKKKPQDDDESHSPAPRPRMRSPHRSSTTRYPSLRRRSVARPEPGVLSASTTEELGALDRAYASKVMYVVGKEQMRVRAGTGFGRKAVLEAFLWIRENTRAKIANLRLAMDRVVEVGFVKDI